MTSWDAKTRLIEKYSSALIEAANDSIDWKNVNDNFDECLIDFADEFEALIINDIKERINNIL